VKSVDIAGVGTVDFPDEMSDEDIGRTIDKEILPQVEAEAAERKRVDDFWAGRGGSEAGSPDDRPGILNQFGHDLRRGASQMQQLGYGLGGLVADAVGADETAKSWLQSYKDIGQDIQQNNPPTIGSYENIHGVGDAFRYGVEAIGENALMAVPSLVTGGLGAVGLRSLAQKGAAGLVEDLVAKGVARDVAEKQAGAYVAKAGVGGAAAGAYASNAGMEMGSIYGDVYEKTGEQAPGTAAVVGAVAGALDTVGETMGLNRIFGRELAETATRSLINRVGVAAAQHFVTEVPTEMLQTILERTAVALQDPSQAVFSKQGVNEIIDAGLKGGIAGAGTGVVAESAGSILDWAKRRGVEPTQENLTNAAAAGDTEAIDILKASRLMSDEQLANLSPEAAERFAKTYKSRLEADQDPVRAAQRTQEARDRADLEGGDPMSEVMRQRADRKADYGGPKREDILKAYDTATQQVDAAIEAGTIKPKERDLAIRERVVGSIPELDKRQEVKPDALTGMRARIDEILDLPADQYTPELADEYIKLKTAVSRSKPSRVIALGQRQQDVAGTPFTAVDGKAVTGYTDDPGLAAAVELRGRPNLPVPLQPKYSPHSEEEIAHQRALMARQGRVVNAGVEPNPAAVPPDTPVPPRIRTEPTTPVMRDAEGFALTGKTAEEANKLRIQAESRATGVNQLYGSENRLVQTPADVTGQRQVEQAMRLKEHLATKAGPTIRDVQAGGRPQGGVESQQTIFLDQGYPVRILEDRTVKGPNGAAIRLAKVRRYDPRTNQDDTGQDGQPVEYEVPADHLTTGRYARDDDTLSPRRAQQFEEEAKTPVVGPYKDASGKTVKPAGAGTRADELQGLPRQTYRTTPPDPTVAGAEGPTTELPGGGPVPRSPRPEQGEGPSYDLGSGKRGANARGGTTGEEWVQQEAKRRQRMNEQADRGETHDEQGQPNDWGSAKEKYANQKTGFSGKPKGVDEDGWPHVDEYGYILSDKVGPIRFSPDDIGKGAMKKRLIELRKAHPDAMIENTYHPGPMRKTGRDSADSYLTLKAVNPKPPKAQQAQQEQAAPEQPAQTGPQRALPGPAPTPDPTPEAPPSPQFTERRVREGSGREPGRRGAERGTPFTAPEASRNDTVSTPEQRAPDTENTPVRNPEQLVASVEKGLRDRQVKPNPQAIARHYEIDERQAANVLATIAGRGTQVIRQVKPSKKELAAALKPSAGAEAPAPKGPRYRLTPQFDEDMSLLEFLMSKGGLAANGDLSAMDAHKKSHPRYGNLVKKQGGGGMSLDEARELAESEGFIGQGTDDYNTTTERDLLEAIEDELRGSRVTTERAGSGSERDQMEARARELGIEVNPDWNDAELMVEIGEADAIAHEDNPTVQAADNLREVVDAMLVEMGIVPDTYSADFDIPFGDERDAGSDQGAGEVGAEAESAAETAGDGAGRQAPDVRSGDRVAAPRTGDAEETGRTGSRQTPAIEKTDQGDQYVLINQASARDGKKTGKGPQTKTGEGLFAEKSEPEPEQIDLEDAIAAAKVDETPTPEPEPDVPAKGTTRENAIAQARLGTMPDAATIKALSNDGKVTTGDAKVFLRAMGLNAKQTDDAAARVGAIDKTEGGAWLYDLKKIIQAGQNVLGVGEGARTIEVNGNRYGINEHNQVRYTPDRQWQPNVIGMKAGDTYLNFNDGERDGAYGFLEDRISKNPQKLTGVKFNEGVWTAHYADRTETGGYTAGDPKSIAEVMNKLEQGSRKWPSSKPKVEAAPAPKAATKPKKPPKRKERAALLSRLFGRDPEAELTAEQEAADDAAWKERLEQIAPRAETVEDVRRILDENVKRGILNKGTAKGISDILGRMPTDGLKGTRLMIQDRMTAEEREILGTAKSVAGEYITFDDGNIRVLTVLGENGSKDAVETFVHENAHVLFSTISEPDKALARQIYDRLPISRQAMHTAGYDKEARFEEWFAESAVDHYAGGMRTEGPRAGIPHMLGGLMQRLFKRIVDTFSNEKAQVDAFFSGLERSLGYSGQKTSIEAAIRRERRSVSTIAILSNPIGAITGDWKAWKAGYQELARDVTEAWKGRGTRPNRQSAAGSLARTFFYSADGEFRAGVGKFNSPTLNMMADIFHPKAGATQGLDRKLATKLGMKITSNATFDESVTRKVNTDLRQLDRVLKGFRTDPAALDRVVDLVQRPSARRSDPESVAAGEIARMLKGLHTYMKDAGVDVGEIKVGYFPREIDVGAVMQDHPGFVTAATKAYRAAGLGAKEAAEAADNWLTNILYGGSGSPARKSGGGSPSFVQSRVLTKQADEILKDFYQRDPDAILGSYITRAVKRAEIARRFGDNWANWEKIEKQIREEDPAAAGMFDHFRSYAATVTGTQHHNVPNIIRQGSSLVRTFATLSLLEKSTFSSLAEAITPVLRTGSAFDFFPAIRKTLNELRRELKDMPPSVAAELAADIGAVAGSGVNSIMAARFAGGDPLGRAQAKVLSTYFRRIGLEQWTDATRVASTERGAVFIRRLARDIAGKGLNPKSARIYMAELGIPTDQLDAFVTYVNGFGDNLPSPDDLNRGGEMGAAYRTALLRFVDQTIMRPNATTRPRWASHPLGAIAFQLQAFTYAFSKNVLLRSGRLATTALTEKDMGLRDRALLLAPLAMLPVLALCQYIVGDLRDWLFMDPERRKAQTYAARVEKSISRAGLTGALDPYLQMVTGARYQKDPISTFTGPFLGVFGAGLGALEQRIANNSPNTNAAERKSTEALYDVLIEPLANMALGFAPVSPLTGLITSGFLPMMRDDFVDSVAGPRIGHKQQPVFGLSELLMGKQFKSQSGTWASSGG
jgi:hypothetical protein